MLMKRHGFVVALCSLLLVWSSNQIWAGDQLMDTLPSFFQKSLHATGEGMRYWYEEQGGFMTIAKIPYAQLGCKNCHVKSCDQCHASTKENGKLAFSVDKARKTETCLVCHTREKLSMKFAKDAGHTDVHLAAAMSCADCHKGHDIHGDGTKYTSMRAPGAVQTKCADCHKREISRGPVFNTRVKAHQVHGNKLDCAACHVRRTMACYNCHFTNFLKTKEKKGNFIPTDDWLMLVNYQGKVTSATAMTLVHDRQTFVTYAPYFTHDVMKKGRPCEECHANEAVTLLSKGKNVPVAKFVGDKIAFWKGVIPIVEDGIAWEFLDKQNGQWAPFTLSPKENAKPDVVQYSLYAEPLTEKQLKKLQLPQGNR